MTTMLPSESACSIDFESLQAQGRGILKDFDDGHVPEIFRGSASKSKLWLQKEEQVDVRLHVYDEALPAHLIQALYEFTLQGEHPSWGAYVTWEEQACVDRNNNAITLLEAKSPLKETQRQVLSQHAAAYFVNTVSQLTGTTFHQGSPVRLDPAEIHGVAVWALRSNPSSQVSYHIDYAELIRYETNVVAPPLWAGTLHCAPHCIEGGAFAVNLQGLPHYQRHGYKGLKSGDHQGGWEQPTNPEQVTVSESQWATIPYCSNRLICHSGSLPHLSTKVEAGTRVILGFNFFGHDLGPHIQPAPEHSPQFRQRVLQWQQRQQEQKLLSLECIQQNRALTKLLVLAKRDRDQQDFKDRQRRLHEQVQLYLVEKHDGVSAEDLCLHLGSTDGSWPNADDVRVYLSQQVRRGNLQADVPYTGLLSKHTSVKIWLN
jgi:hypothetical protein